MELLQVAKITLNGRISLGAKTLNHLGAKEGDHVQLYCDDSGRICIMKVVPPERGE